MLTWIALVALFGAQTSERLVWPSAEGFIVAHSQTAANGSIEEQVPTGESVQAWTRMITSISMGGPIDPTDFANRMAGMWRQTCTGAVASTPVDGPNGVDLRVDCPRNAQTGKPETMFQRTVAGKGKLYVLQVAFRSVPDAEQVRWATAQLDRATLCQSDSKKAACGKDAPLSK